MSREFQVYQGAEPQAAQVHVQDAPSIPALPNYSKIVQSSIDHVIEMGEHYAKLHDAGEDQRIESERDTLNTELNTELRTAAQGSGDDYLFRADGTINTDKRDAIIAKYQEKSRAIQGNHWLEVGAQRFAGEQAAQDRKITADVVSFTELSRISKSKDALSNNYDLAISQGRFKDAARIARMGSGTIVPESQAELMAYNAEKKGAEDELGALAASNPDEAYDKLNSGAYDRYMSPYDKQKFLSALRKSKEETAPAEFTKSFLAVDNSPDGNGSGNGSGGKKDSTPEFTGYFSEQECTWLRAIRGGKADEVRPQMTRAMIEEARAFDPNQDEEEFRAAYEHKWHDVFGFDKDFVSRQLTLAGKRREKLGNYAIDAKQRLDNMESGGALYNATTWQQIEAGAQNVDNIKARYGAALGLKPDTDDAEVKRKYLAYRRKAHASELRGRITERYDAWMDTEEGSKAAPVVQREKLLSIAREVTGNKNIGVGEALSLNADARLASQTQAVRHADWEQSRGKLYYIRPTQPGAEPYAQATVGFNAERKELPEGVLLPASMVQGRKPEDMVVEMTYDNKHVRRFRVVGTTEGDTPEMTYAVARKGGYATDKAYNVALRIRNGNTDALMQPFEHPLGAASVVGDLSIDRAKAAPASADRLGGLAPYRQAFIDAGNKYGIDPNFLMAISMNETGRGTSRVFREQHNAMGVYDHAAGRSRTFSSVAESIDYMAGQLKKNYFDKGLVSIARIGAKYAPVGASNDPRGLNGGWVPTVTRFYNELSR